MIPYLSFRSFSSFFFFFFCFFSRYNPDTTNAMKNMLSSVDGYFIEGELRTWPTL